MLSVVLDMGTYIRQAANGREVQESVTANLETGDAYYFFELFNPGSYFKARIDHIILRQIKERQIPTISTYPGVTNYQSYYLTNTMLVVYFQEIVFTPHSSGIPEFPIRFTEIADIVRADGAIGKLMAPDPA